MAENWRLCNSNANYIELCEKLKLSELTVRLLVNRGHKEETDIERYLFPSFDNLYPAELMKDMKQAVEIIYEKIKSKKKIRIIGDYDVDGVTATYILLDILLKCDAIADYRIPDRIKDGYGLNVNLVEEAINDNIDTILTCDNGIAAVNEVALAREKGITVVITDHHELPDVLPVADAIINTKQKDCEYPFKELCGAVIAAKFADSLYERVTGKKQIFREYIGELALATICDVMELTDENRIIVKLGLAAISKTKKPGLKKLIEKNKLQDTDITATHLGYVLGPCLNATGRLDSAKRGVELLLADNDKDAEVLADELLELNEKRKLMTETQAGIACEIAVSDKYKDDKVVIIYLNDCHESLAGIIAGRVREKIYKPVIVFTDSEDSEHDIIKGSGRSIEGYHMFNELNRLSEYFEKYGGHALAAGMSIKKDMLPKLRQALNENCILSEEQMMQKVLIDGIVPPELLTEAMVNEIELLEPYGKGNRKPLLSVKALPVRRMYIIGKNANYLKFVLGTKNNHITALYFGDGNGMMAEIAGKYGPEELEKALAGRENAIALTIAYVPTINKYMDNTEIQVIINHYKMV